MKTKIRLSLLLLIIIGCSNPVPGQPEALPNDVKWARYSVEYEAICTQTYRMAWTVVKETAAKTKGDWAVVFDVDETVLDNSWYEEYIYQHNEKYPFYWDEWVKQAEAEPIPGAVAFIDSVRSLGKLAHIVFITNRDTSQEAATIANLKKHGMWKEGDLILCRRNKEDVKEFRRREVMNGTGRCEGLGKRTIIALFGDQLHDLVKYSRGTPPQQLIKTYKEAREWGTRWFVLPNPMYGPWSRGYQ